MKIMDPSAMTRQGLVLSAKHLVLRILDDTGNRAIAVID